jgi:hypothetical protein
MMSKALVQPSLYESYSKAGQCIKLRPLGHAWLKRYDTCEISGYHGGEYEDDRLLRFYAL